MMSSPVTRPHRFAELDMLRGFAAIWVLLFHYLTQYPRLYAPTDAPFLGIEFPDGIYGVYLFFMISGNVIFMTLRNSAHPLDFVVARFSRLYPAYWISLAATATIAVLAPLPGQSVSAATIAVDATMLQSFLLLFALGLILVKTTDTTYIKFINNIIPFNKNRFDYEKNKNLFKLSEYPKV